MVRLEAMAAVQATEVLERVQQAVTAFLPGATVHDAGGLIATSEDPTALRERIWAQRIVDAFRARARVHGGRIRITLSKQAAFQGKIAFPAGKPGPLDRLELDIEVDGPWVDAEAFLWWLCPRTEDGKIVGPTDAEATFAGPVDETDE